MSHAATNWAIAQRGLKPAAKIVLWYLCDRYHPDHGCFPSQETMAFDCEMSRSTINIHLSKLEDMGLIKRIVRFQKGTHQKKSTLYILGCQDEFEQYVGKPCPESGHGNSPKAMSEKQPKPCPENGQSHVRIPDSNPVREPVIEPVRKREAIASQKKPDQTTNVVALSLFSEEAGLEVEKPKPKRKSALPDNWVPSQKNIDDARKKNFTDQEISHEAEQFRDYHLARGTVFKNWDAGWRTWIRNARRFGSRRGPDANRAAAEMDRESFLRQNDEAGRIAIARYQSWS